jgi:hypothetical protein
MVVDIRLKYLGITNHSAPQSSWSSWITGVGIICHDRKAAVPNMKKKQTGAGISFSSSAGRTSKEEKKCRHPALNEEQSPLVSSSLFSCFRGRTDLSSMVIALNFFLMGYVLECLEDFLVVLHGSFLARFDVMLQSVCGHVGIHSGENAEVDISLRFITPSRLNSSRGWSGSRLQSKISNLLFVNGSWCSKYWAES